MGEGSIGARDPRQSVWYSHESVYRAEVALLRKACETAGNPFSEAINEEIRSVVLRGGGEIAVTHILLRMVMRLHCLLMIPPYVLRVIALLMAELRLSFDRLMLYEGALKLACTCEFIKAIMQIGSFVIRFESESEGLIFEPKTVYRPGVRWSPYAARSDD
ncbi:hypothetical protein EVAR_53771_1 [Eumeta japonica]|uniref:Uncharacterized protein n=1 Tax=Eumeta variegata TaxID=151549 RepID=A0A4C1Z552_EUMVA|nr:hypothetical protein EVAR_53771_1 [Eumeta japonica]